MQNEEVKFDEDFIKFIHDNMKKVIEAIGRDLEILINPEEDSFLRYMISTKMEFTLKQLKTTQDLLEMAITRGHNINHKFLLNECAKINHWGEIDLSSDPLFKSPEKDSISKINDLDIDAFKKFLEDNLLDPVNSNIKEKNELN